MRVVKENYIELMQLLVSRGADYNYKKLTHGKSSSLGFVASEEMLDILMSYGFKISDCKQGSNIPDLYTTSSAKVLKKAIELGLDLTQKNEDGMGIQHMIAFFCDVECLQILQNAGVDLSMRSNVKRSTSTSGITPAAYAFSSGKLEAFAMLLEHDIKEGKFCSEDYHDFLLQAINRLDKETQGKKEITLKKCDLLFSKSNLQELFFYKRRNKSQFDNILIRILQEDKPSLEGLELILKHIDLKNEKNKEYVNDALQTAASKGYNEHVEMLLKYGADVHYTQKLKSGHMLNAIHNSILYGGNVKTVQLLKEYGADLKYVEDKEKESLLHTAVSEAKLEIVKFLIAEGCEVNAANKLGRTPLMNALHLYDKKLEKSIQEIRQLLLGAGGDLQRIDTNRNNAFHMAFSYANSKVTNITCSQCSIETLEQLHAAGVDINARNTAANTPLMFALCAGANYEIIKWLIDKGAEIKPEDKIFEKAAAAADVQTLELLYKEGDAISYKALECAIRGRNIAAFKWLVGKVQNLQQDSSTLLVSAMQHLTEEVLEILAAHKIHFNYDQSDSFNLHFAALSHGKKNIAEWLVKNRANKRRKKDESDVMDTTEDDAMDTAVLPSDNTAEFLQRYGVDINATNQQGETILMLNCKYNHVNYTSIQDFIDSGGNINALDKAGRNALWYAIQLVKKGLDKQKIQILIEHGITDIPAEGSPDREIKMEALTKAVIKAIECQDIETLKLIKEHQPSVFVNNNKLLPACCATNVQCLEFLAEAGLNLCARDEHNNNLLHLTTAHVQSIYKESEINQLANVICHLLQTYPDLLSQLNNEKKVPHFTASTTMDLDLSKLELTRDSNIISISNNIKYVIGHEKKVRNQAKNNPQP